MSIMREGYHQPADEGTDRIGRQLFGDQWVVSNAQVAEVGRFLRGETSAEPSQLPALMGASSFAPGALGAAIGRLGPIAGRVAGKLAPKVGRIAREVVKVAGGWAIWNGVEWIFSDKNPHGRRRMNVMNVRALKRADRRVQGFAVKAVPVLRQLGYQVERTASRKKKGHTHADHHRGHNSKEWMAHIRKMRKSK